MQQAMAVNQDVRGAGAHLRGTTAVSAPLPFKCSWDAVLELDSNPVGQRSALNVVPVRNNAQREQANGLVRKMYSGRGYETDFLASAVSPHQMTFNASAPRTDCLGTVTVIEDSIRGLQVDGLFPDEVQAARDQGRRVCEFSRLAVDQFDDSKKVLASLFQVAFLYCKQVKECDDIFIEVNPRHAPFYIRMLGFEKAAEVKICPRVNAPAVLLRMDTRKGAKKVEKFCSSVLAPMSALQ